MAQHLAKAEGDTGLSPAKEPENLGDFFAEDDGGADDFDFRFDDDSAGGEEAEQTKSGASAGGHPCVSFGRSHADEPGCEVPVLLEGISKELALPGSTRTMIDALPDPETIDGQPVVTWVQGVHCLPLPESL